jgi:uncharacterized membrane-anchored protein
MQLAHVPSAGARYWAALSIASVFGANCGDFIARYFKLGHTGGLLPLAIILAIILIAERRDKFAHQAYYWAAIIVIRAAATNLADFGASDLALKKIWLIAALAALLLLALAVSPPAKSVAPPEARAFRLPSTDARYWVAMLIAGTLGTVIGDVMSFESGLGTLYASLVLASMLAVIFLLGAKGWFGNLWFYWLAVVTVRAAGTSLSDFLAHNVFGLPLSTLVTGILFVATLLVWKEPSPLYRTHPGTAA